MAALWERNKFRLSPRKTLEFRRMSNLHDCVEVVVDENHVGRLFAHVCAILPHRDADVSSLQSHPVVDSVACHTDNVAGVLERLHDGKLVLGRDSIEDADAVDDLLQLHLVHLVDFMAADGLLVDRVQADEMGCETKVSLKQGLMSLISNIGFHFRQNPLFVTKSVWDSRQKFLFLLALFAKLGRK